MADFRDKGNFFEEKQYFRQKWIWLLIGITIMISVIPIMLIPGDTSFLFRLLTALPAFFVMGLTGLFIWNSNLITEINKEGIYYRFVPFHWKKKFIAWKDIKEYHIRSSKPIMEFGGWGIKRKIFSKTTAVTVSGVFGIELFLKNGKRIFLGTQKPEEMQEALLEIFDSESENAMDLEDPEYINPEIENIPDYEPIKEAEKLRNVPPEISDP